MAPSRSQKGSPQTQEAAPKPFRFTIAQYYRMAEAGIPEPWIVNLTKPQLEIHRDPDSDEARYRELHTLDAGEAATLPALGGCEVVWWG